MTRVLGRLFSAAVFAAACGGSSPGPAEGGADAGRDAAADHLPSSGTDVRDSTPFGEGGWGDAPAEAAAGDGPPAVDGPTDVAAVDGPTEAAVADALPADLAQIDAASGDRRETDAPPDAPTDQAGGEAGLGSDGGADSRPPDPCATNQPLSTVGCNGEPRGPSAANTFGGRCTTTAGGPAAGTCLDPTHFCAEDQCVRLCTATASTEVSTGGCPPGARCWNSGLLTFCYPDCRTGADCATGRCDSARGICRGP